VDLAYTRLSAAQRAALDRYLDVLADRELRGRRSALRIGVYLEDGFVDLEFRLPGREPLRQRAMAFSVSGAGMERIYHDALLHLLAREPTPREALLGARLRAQREADPVTGAPMLVGQPIPAVSSDDPGGLLRYARLSGSPLSYPEFLDLIERGGYSLVSDYYTSSLSVLPGKHLPAEGNHPLRTLLAGVARPFDRVFLVEKRTVLSRHCWWPDRDEEEPPYPQPDAWLEAKRRKPSLSVQHLAGLARLTVPQQNCMAAYGSFPRSFSRGIRFLRTHRPLAAFLAAVPDRLAGRIDAPGGLRISDLPTSARRLLYPAIGMQGGPNPAVERAVLRVIERPAPLASRSLYLIGQGDLPFWNFALP
jgi:hypothetical protein